ncbi:hypothetical protein C8J56DRAFT_5772 [Mycena floridula]|nr:hypothetical protein C8J56DRAFT_5772 [Mycena floridula]
MFSTNRSARSSGMNQNTMSQWRPHDISSASSFGDIVPSSQSTPAASALVASTFDSFSSFSSLSSVSPMDEISSEPLRSFPRRHPRNISVSFSSNPLRHAMALSGVLEEYNDEPEESITPAPSHSMLSFSRRSVAPIKCPEQSGLTTLFMNPTANHNNAFNDLMRLSIPTTESLPAVNVQVYFPYAEAPHSEMMNLSLKRNATVKDLIGLALWNYWKHSWSPQLSIEALVSKTAISRFTDSWSAFLVNEDRSIDYNIETLDESDRLEFFGSGRAYAVMRTCAHGYSNPVKHNRRVSLPAVTSRHSGHKRHLSLSSLTSSSLSDFTHKFMRPVRLSIIVASPEKAEIVETEIPSDSTLRLQQVLDQTCEQRWLDPQDYTFLFSDHDYNLRTVSLDLAVSKLRQRELVLIKRKV